MMIFHKLRARERIFVFVESTELHSMDYKVARDGNELPHFPIFLIINEFCIRET